MQYYRYHSMRYLDNGNAVIRLNRPVPDNLLQELEVRSAHSHFHTGRFKAPWVLPSKSSTVCSKRLTVSPGNNNRSASITASVSSGVCGSTLNTKITAGKKARKRRNEMAAARVATAPFIKPTTTFPVHGAIDNADKATAQ